ncbi:potassium-transporting ATPase subunit F [Candidatus Protochlamydia phocaeensis]|nr:potassium-transporting ATPase subunit F [Candidatus Protochlamydia phocaeensis]
MQSEFIWGGILSIFLLIYLIHTILHPEKY